MSLSFSGQFFFVWFFILGASIGSFLNVVIYRMPRGFFLSLPRRSFCPSCKTKLRWFENIPVVSFFVLLGRCRHCKTSISMRYLIVELLCGILFVAVYRSFGLNFETFYYAYFVAALLAITFIDIDFRIIPDAISISGIFLGFIGSVLGSLWGFQVSWEQSLLGIAFGGGFFWFLAWGYEKLRGREGLGLGDVKLLAMIGAFLGLKGVLITMFLSSIVGSVVGIIMMIVQKKDLKLAIPFGPFLAIGALIFLFWGEALILNIIPADMTIGIN